MRSSHPKDPINRVTTSARAAKRRFSNGDGIICGKYHDEQILDVITYRDGVPRKAVREWLPTAGAGRAEE